MSNVTRRNFLLNSAVAVGGAAATLALATPAQAEESSSSEEDIYSGVLDEDGWRQLVVDVADEGIVLLKNNDSTLPFEKGAKLNLLGYGAYNPCYSGSGSGSVSADDAVSIVQSLEDAGFELNPALEALYPAAQIEGRKIGWTTITLAHSEISIDSYSGDTSFESLKEYSENAVIVLGRSGGEAYDLIAFDGGDYLELAENEKALLEKACATFDHVAVVLNMANALEMDQLSTYDVDAMVWCGLPGPYGFTSLGRVLDGEVNPSGKLPDTWAMVRDSNPTWENFGDQQATNADAHFVDYVEGIYVGYKWYETAFAESAKITCVKTGNTFDFADYDSIVAYPFGYGLSYTTFDQKFSGTPSSMEPHGTLEFKVDVTNTGTVAGKQAVELYLSAPYTTYDQTAGIEKAAVELVGIAKTDLLEAGKSQTVTIQLDVEDLASYDSTHANSDGTTGAYMLDAGDYVFSIRSDAHTSIEETTVSLGSDYFYSGSIDKRSSDVVQASNQFEDAARGEYLSRKDAFANYESAMKSVSPTVVSTAWQDQNQDYYSILDDEVTKTYQEGVDYAASGSLTMADVQGLAYDDPTWDELIKQLTVDEMHTLICDALYKTPEVASIQKAGTIDSDGPLGISSMFNTAISSIAYPCIPVLCATFNTTLAKQFGRSISAQAQNLGVTGWYAPAMDNHRSPYSGRNFEYYSEDGTLAAIMASAEVTGARSGGTIVYIKHFALNDQETNRASHLHTYSNEQAIREIYLKPFEWCVKDGGANAIMTSMNYIGDIFCGGHYNLLTNVLRGEWGFRGKSLTDMDEYGERNNAIESCMRAGTDAWLVVGDCAFPEGTPSNAEIYYLQRAAKDILYTEANSTVVEAKKVNWRMYLGILTGELGVLAAAAVGAAVMTNVGKSGEKPAKKDGTEKDA